MLPLSESKLIDTFQERPQSLAWFLGAGASRNAGLPTATDIIWDLKRKFYQKAENQEIAPQDMQTEAVRSKVQNFMDARGFPPLWADEEYSIYFEKIFGDDRERQRRYIIKQLSDEQVSLSLGNRVMGALIAGGYSRVTFTTNFDAVVEMAVAQLSGQAIAAYHLEGPASARRALDNEEYPFYCKLHGDFRYDSLKNLTEDLATQNAELAACLVNAGNRFGFVVAGYSGRDLSVMNLFHDVLKSPNPFPHGLFWTGIGKNPLPAVTALLDAAKARNVLAEYVVVDSFDTLMSRLWRGISNKPKNLDEKVRRSASAEVHIPLAPSGSTGPILRMNTLLVRQLPTECHSISAKRVLEWTDLRRIRNEAEQTVLLTKADTICAWGQEQDIRDSFGRDLLRLDKRSVPPDFSTPQHFPFKAFMEEAIAIGLARGKPLLVRTKPSAAYLIIDAHSEDVSQFAPLTKAVQTVSGVLPGLLSPTSEDHPVPSKVSWSECLRISLDRRGDQTWLNVSPDVWIWPQHARELAQTFLDRRKGGRFNKLHNAILDAWLRILLGDGDRNSDVIIKTFEGQPGAGNPSFVLTRRTAFSRRILG
ncbi:SIR2 family protein [Sinorhizobium fredii]|uniref:SIR2 family protein n=1 Tax=Rhizobium fredii TaxID=380 RepID=UPI003519BAE8